MANNLSTVNENILVTKFQNTSLGDSDRNKGVIVINPNKVRDPATNIITDRYVNQEDMVMYANLKVYKQPSTAIFKDSSDKNDNVINVGGIRVNMMNPIKSIVEGVNTNKGKLTTDYTDYFTAKSFQFIDDGTTNYNSGDSMVDPETFGIDSINISQNPSMNSMIKIEFTDVRGKTLFERGHDPNNPYNLFYTFPYPTFILSLKGFYGKTVDYPLILLKSNTRFDPETGNYKISAEFVSRTFSIYNSFLLIYAYVAPYMFQKKDGSYLGMEILKKLYAAQNDYFTKKFTDLTQRSKYIINDNPTILDLHLIKNKLNADTLLSDDSVVKNNETILSLDATKILLNINYDIIIQNNSNSGAKDYTTLYNSLYEIDQAISGISDARVQSNIKNVLPNKSNVQSFLGSTKTIDFFYKNIQSFADTFQKLIDQINKEKSELNANVVDTELTILGNKLGFQPNTYNVFRILFNNIQTFLILLNISGKKALYEINNDVNYRLSNQRKDGEYIKSNGVEKYSPYPNFFYKEPDTTSDNNLFQKSYPGGFKQNDSWAEVRFVDEIYNAVSYLKTRLTPPEDKPKHGDIPAALSTNFYVGNNIEYYNKDTQDHLDFMGNMIRTFQLNYIYSGNIFKWFAGHDFNEIMKANGNFEFDIFNTTIFSKLTDELKYKTAIELKNLIKGSLSDHYNDIKKDIENGTTVDVSGLLKVIDGESAVILQNNYTETALKGAINNRKKFFSKYALNSKLLGLLNPENSQLTYNDNTVSPIFNLRTFDKQKNYFVPSDIQNNFNALDTVKYVNNSEIDKSGYIFGTANNKIIRNQNKNFNVNNYKVDRLLKNYERLLPTLTYTIDDPDLLNKLIGFNSTTNSEQNNFNYKDIYNF